MRIAHLMYTDVAHIARLSSVATLHQTKNVALFYPVTGMKAKGENHHPDNPV